MKQTVLHFEEGPPQDKLRKYESHKFVTFIAAILPVQLFSPALEFNFSNPRDVGRVFTETSTKTKIENIL